MLYDLERRFLGTLTELAQSVQEHLAAVDGGMPTAGQERLREVVNLLEQRVDTMEELVAELRSFLDAEVERATRRRHLSVGHRPPASLEELGAKAWKWSRALRGPSERARRGTGAALWMRVEEARLRAIDALRAIDSLVAEAGWRLSAVTPAAGAAGTDRPG